MKQYGKIISRLRKENNMTQAELGAHLNVSYQAVSKWENDLSQPDFSTMVQIAELFHAPLSVFTEESVEADPHTSVLGYCTTCGNAVTEENLAQKRPLLLCKDCAAAEHERREREEEAKKAAEVKKAEEARNAELVKIQARNRGLVWSAIITGILTVIALISVITTQESVGSGILGTVVFALFIFPFIAQLFWDGFISEVCQFGGKVIGTPGIIFTFDLDGFIFLIGMKILFAVLRFFVFVLTFLLAVAFAILCSPFTFLPAMARVTREGVQ